MDQFVQISVLRQLSNFNLLSSNITAGFFSYPAKIGLCRASYGCAFQFISSVDELI